MAYIDKVKKKGITFDLRDSEARTLIAETKSEMGAMTYEDVGAAPTSHTHDASDVTGLALNRLTDGVNIATMQSKTGSIALLSDVSDATDSLTLAINSTGVNRVKIDSASTGTYPVVGMKAGTGDQGATLHYNSGIYVNAETGVLMGAAWNDFAEYRTCNENLRAGQVVQEVGDDTVKLCGEDCGAGCYVISDTYGMLIGEKDNGLPIAVAGRVLAYTEEPQEVYKEHIGWPVCSALDGKVRLMTDKEVQQASWKMIGTVSAVPNYEYYGKSKVAVDGRVWIKI